MIFGCASSGSLQSKLGQRKTLIIVTILAQFMWIGMTLVPIDWVWLMQIVGVIQGAIFGVIYVAANSFVVEVSHKSYRGRMAGTLSFMAKLGTMVVYLY